MINNVELRTESKKLFDEISDYFYDYVVFSYPEESYAITPWCAGRYLMDAWQLWPKIYMHFPESECGITTLLNEIEALVKDDVMTANITPAAHYHVVELKNLHSA